MTQGSESIEDDLSKIHSPVILNQSVYRPPSVNKDSKFKLPGLEGQKSSLANYQAVIGLKREKDQQ
jgi:hypothetical protein